MHHFLKKSMVALAVWGMAYASYAAEPLNSQDRTYKVIHLERVVSNHPDCRSMYYALKKLTDKPLTFTFSKRASEGYQVKDGSGMMNNHSYRIIQQTTNGQTLNRVGMGSFEVDNQSIDYVITISADADQDDYQYEYPIILSSHLGHCYYTALVQPDKATAAAFRKNIQTGQLRKNET